MEKLRLKEALEFSVEKWEAIVKNDGESISVRQKDKLGIHNFIFSCGLCQYQKQKEDKSYFCEGCIFLTSEDHHGMKNCDDYGHPWKKWFKSSSDNLKGAAQDVLDALIKLRYKVEQHEKWK